MTVAGDEPFDGIWLRLTGTEPGALPHHRRPRRCQHRPVHPSDPQPQPRPGQPRLPGLPHPAPRRRPRRRMGAGSRRSRPERNRPRRTYPPSDPRVGPASNRHPDHHRLRRGHPPHACHPQAAHHPDRHLLTQATPPGLRLSDLATVVSPVPGGIGWRGVHIKIGSGWPPYWRSDQTLSRVVHRPRPGRCGARCRLRWSTSWKLPLTATTPSVSGKSATDMGGGTEWCSADPPICSPPGTPH